MLAQGIQFSVVITEGRPDETGLTMAQALDNMRVPTIAILDCAVAFALEAFRCAALPAHPWQCWVTPVHNEKFELTSRHAHVMQNARCTA